MTSKRLAATAVGGLLSALVLVGCGESEPAAELADDWDGIVEAATEEGEVTIYSTHSPDNLESLKKAFEEKYPGREFYFFGDNTSKDFIVPDRLGWRKICLLDTGRHIHKQSFGKNTLPDYFITSFADINLAVISC